MEQIEIVEYEDRYQEDLKRLSYEWLLKYDLLEPEDEKILSYPRETAIDSGGNIFFAKQGERIIGTASIIRVDESSFEIAKLAVAEDYRGLGTGRLLVEKCIAAAREKSAEKVILYSNRRLASALALYKKLGFVEIPSENAKYLTSDVKMELNI